MTISGHECFRFVSRIQHCFVCIRRCKIFPLCAHPCISKLKRFRNSLRVFISTIGVKRWKKKAKKRWQAEQQKSTAFVPRQLCCCLLCFMALFHVELKIQEHHRAISQSATFCDQMENEILQKVQQNYERWQINNGSPSDGDWFEAQGKVISPYRSPGGSLLDEGYIQLNAL